MYKANKQPRDAVQTPLPLSGGRINMLGGIPLQSPTGAVLAACTTALVGLPAARLFTSVSNTVVETVEIAGAGIVDATATIATETRPVFLS